MRYNLAPNVIILNLLLCVIKKFMTQTSCDVTNSNSEPPSLNGMNITVESSKHPSVSRWPHITYPFFFCRLIVQQLTLLLLQVFCVCACPHTRMSNKSPSFLTHWRFSSEMIQLVCYFCQASKIRLENQNPLVMQWIKFTHFGTPNATSLKEEQI